MDSLTRIRAFIDVVEAEGYSAAARRIGRSKALLSKYVRELEDELGVLLLNRTTRRFSLTEIGHTYYRTAADIVRDIDNLTELVRENAAHVRGRIRISAPRTFADAAIGQSLIDFAAAYPDVALEIVADDRFVDLVEEGFDLAIRIAHMDDSGLIARKLADFSLVLCASADFLRANDPIEHPGQLARLPCIIDTNGRFLNNWRFQEENGTAFTVSVQGRLEVNSPLAAMRAARTGIGIALLPDFIARDAIEKSELLPLLGGYLPADRGIYAIYPHRRYLPAKIRALVDFLAQWFRTAT